MMPVDSYLVGGFNPTHLKNMLVVKMASSSPIFGGENSKNYVQNHHLYSYGKSV